MNVFAMDTSSVTATVAILNDEKLIGEYSVSARLTHSQKIMPMTNELLSDLSMSLNDIDVFSVCVGPGSFTGLRIGMATVKTFAQTLGKKIVGVSSLDAIAYNFCCVKDTVICTMVDARRDEVYNALYLNGEKIVFDRALDIGKLLEELKDKKVIFAGDGAIIHKEKLLDNPNWTVSPMHLIMPSASSVAYCAYLKAQNSEFDDFYTLNPVYLRKCQAERELEEKNNK